jgi:hypothetical protein
MTQRANDMATSGGSRCILMNSSRNPLGCKALPAWLKLHDHGGRIDPRSGSTFDSARIAHLKFESAENSDDRGDLPPALFGPYEQSEIK